MRDRELLAFQASFSNYFIKSNSPNKEIMIATVLRLCFFVFFLVLVSIYQTLKTVTKFPNTSKLIMFSTLFAMFGNVVKHDLSC